MGREQPVRKSFMRSLLHDKAANTIVISAAALMPLTAMVGGGVDASRYYMAAARMQAACDAGALAARRAMITDTFTEEHRTIGYNFFDQNFETAMFGIQERERLYTSNGEGTVTGTASGTLPTTIMGIFGYEGFDINVTCSAEINISNTDIQFVLDTTGSMNCPDDNIDGCTNGNNNNTEVANSLIVGLRAAVLNFYDTVEEATSDSAQVRYGVVTYAPNVNVGFLLPRQYLANSHTYQSREANFTTTPGTYTEVSSTMNSLTVVSKGSTATVVRTTIFGGTEAACTALKPANKVEFNDSLGPFGQQSQSVTGNIRTTVYNDTDENILIFEAFDSQYRASDKRCRYGWNRFDGKGNALWTLVEQRGPDVQAFADWTYKPVTYDLTSLYDDNMITLPVNTSGTDRTITWNGCIEEAASVNTATWNPVPADAYDLDINLKPSTEAQKWKPMLRNAVYSRVDSSGNRQLANRTTTSNLSNPTHDCPSASRKLSEISRADLETYVNGLVARGSTYHDIGMIWGARLISPNGLFASENATAPNGDAIGRHIVFMTDGYLSPNVGQYGTYGLEWWDRRVTADGNTDAKARHEARFQAACRAARQENITVWVVSFGEDITPELESCASPGRSYEAANNEELTEAFEEIAQKIAALRLTS